MVRTALCLVGVFVLLLVGVRLIIGVLETPQGLTVRANLGEFPLDQPSVLQDLSHAKARWSAQSVAHYRLVIERHYEYPRDDEVADCHETLEIADQRVVKTLESMCSTSVYWSGPGGTLARTVADLFDEIERYASLPGRISHDGCEIAAITVEFDPFLGYPRAIKYEQQLTSPANLGLQPFLARFPSGHQGLNYYASVGTPIKEIP